MSKKTLARDFFFEGSVGTFYNTWHRYPQGTYSGLHLEVELTSRDGGAPPGRSAREAIGGVGPIVTTSRHKPFSEFSNFDYLQS